ncbi:hypothetical protein Plec18167_002939 [Paecilomyces lecythidis]|uniref:Uncharacterized protein n=1 Tax=Paecilomyces lecythidis TaxID=3004212 RepID=A0ABR3Y3W2_9EURO
MADPKNSLSAPVGILADASSGKGDTVSLRALISSTTRNHEYTAEGGTKVKEEYMVLSPEFATEQSRIDLASSLVNEYNNLKEAAKKTFDEEYCRWKTQRQEWEWQMFAKNRDNPGLIWPRGMSTATIQSALRHDAILN